MTQMKPWKWIVLALLTYVFFLIAYLPASHVITYAQNQAPTAPISIGKVEGSLWEGKVDRVVVQGVLVNKLSWSLSPFALLTGKASLDIKGGNIRETEQAYVKGNISASLFNQQAIQANNLQLFLPAKTVMAQVPLPVPVSADGRFRIDINELDFNAACVTLDGKGRWLNGTVTAPTGLIDFGNYEANLSCESEKFALQILPDNKLNLDAKVVLSVDGKYSINGKFKPDASFPKEVQQGAAFFGRADAQGFRTISL
ncbi:type II secretion system protein N [Glaciecola sp. MH2013]|uniref:type II secretion system protein N n=1 Tax=Glaciecola sp. MH2013 TaxID=2785524 RepID=UPI00189DD873|nr:type II secretion system protein N [Glaciecola sp. MH2013]MBF7074362.1 type II secretion system protein N [Glaciecola sp. MH2013]